MSIIFTQFLRPHGTRQEILIKRNSVIEMMATQLVHAGCRFEIEELMSGKISMTVENYEYLEKFNAPVSRSICENGPAVIAAVDSIIVQAFEKIMGEAEESA